MATSRTPLLADDHRSVSSTGSHEHEETALLGGLFTTSPARPFATSFYPTLFTRSLALILALPAFIIFIVHGPHFAAAIVFLSFAIARQIFVLGALFGSQILVIHIEIVHHGLKAASAKAQEKWIKRGVAVFVDGVIALGLLVMLNLVAKEFDHEERLHAPKTIRDAVILGSITLGLLLLSVPDFADPALVTLTIAVEKPVEGVLKLATSVLHGEPDRSGEIEGENSV